MKELTNRAEEVGRLGYTLHPYKASFGTGVAVRYNGNPVCDFQLRAHRLDGIETDDGWQASQLSFDLVKGVVLPELQPFIYPAMVEAIRPLLIRK